MKGKIIGIFVCMLLIGTIFSISATVATDKTALSFNKGKTLYVGGDGPGNYSRIQDAIDNASDGDTIFVYNGTYNMTYNTMINISIRLIGENKFNTILYGAGIWINVSNVEISGFTFKNGFGIVVLPISEEISNNIISDNIFTFEEYIVGLGGINIFNSNYSTVSDNSFFNCGLIINSYHNSVYNNTINDKPLVYFEETSDKVINDAGQVILINCDNIKIEKLEFSNTLCGIQLFNTINCLIVDNDFSRNTLVGLFVNSSKNKISGNIFSINALGLAIVDCKGNKISQNSFENNGFSLLFASSSCNTISYNNFKYSHKSRNRNIISTISHNTWNGNYWNRPRLLPVLIWNFKRTNLRLIPLLPTSPDIDWRPAKKLNDLNIVKGHWSTLERTIPSNKLETASLLFNLLEINVSLL